MRTPYWNGHCITAVPVNEAIAAAEDGCHPWRAWALPRGTRAIMQISLGGWTRGPGIEVSIDKVVGFLSSGRRGSGTRSCCSILARLPFVRLKSLDLALLQPQ